MEENRASLGNVFKPDTFLFNKDMNSTWFTVVDEVEQGGRSCGEECQ